MQIIAWLVAAMFAFAPPRPNMRDAERARYEEIARDVADVAYDPDEAPLFDDQDGAPSGRARTALLLTSIAAHESVFRRDVDDGRARGDSGHSWCLMQINIGKRRTLEGWSGEDLVADRTKCFRAGLHVARESFRMCAGYPTAEKLGAYASGKCGSSVESRQMVTRATAFFRRHPATDRDFLFLEPSSAWTFAIATRD